MLEKTPEPTVIRLPSGLYRVTEEDAEAAKTATDNASRSVPDPSMWQVEAAPWENGRLLMEDPEGWFAAVVRSDGCVDLRHYHNLPLREPDPTDARLEDYIHVCDLDDFIARLQSLRAAAKAKYGADWGR